jgi:hypothetical protein
LSNGGMLMNTKSLQVTHLSLNVHGTEHAFILHVHFTIMTITFWWNLVNILPLSANVVLLVWKGVKASIAEPEFVSFQSMHL